MGNQLAEDGMSAIVGIYCRDDNPAVAEQGETFMRVLSRFPAHDVQALRPDGGTFLVTR